MVTLRFLACGLVVALALLLALLPSSCLAGQPDWRPSIALVDHDANRIDDALDASLAALAPATDPVVPVELLFSGEPPQQSVDAFISCGGCILHRYRALGFGWTGTLPLRQVVAVRDGAGPGLLLLGGAHPIRMHLDEATRNARVRQVWGQGVTGSPDTTIGVVDSGVDATHSDLVGRMAYWHDYTADLAASPEDMVGHGTLLAGIAAGTGATSAASPKSLLFTASGDVSGLAVDQILPAYVHTSATGPVTWSMTARWLGGGSAKLYAAMRANSGGTLSILGSWLGTSPLSASLVNFVPASGYRFTPALPKTSTMGGFSVASSLPFVAPADGFAAEQGCAPGARWAGMKVIDRTGVGTDLGVAAALDDAVAMREELGLKVLVLSFGVPGGSPLLRSRVNACAAAGILVCCSSGNDGPTGLVVDPGTAWGALTVGATSDTNQLTSYTSVGTTVPDADGDAKPDLLAPGGSDLQSHILSADTNSSDAGGLMADLQPNDYACGKGTSMSAAMAAGVSALVIQAMGQGGTRWDWSGSSCPMLVKMLLCATSTEVNLAREGNLAVTPLLGRATTPKDRAEGYGLLNADAAIEAATAVGAWDAPITGTSTGGAFDRRCWARRFSLSATAPHIFALDVPSAADYDLYLYSAVPGPKGNPVLLAASCAASAGADETISYTPSSACDVLLVVKRVSGSGQWSLVATRPPMVHLTSPNGGEQWPLSGRRSVAWDQQSLVGTSVAIDLLRDGVVVQGITAATPAVDGVFQWQIPDALVPGGRYSVRITGQSVSDESDGTFSLEPMATTVTVAGSETSPAATVTLSATLQRSEGATGLAGRVVAFLVDGTVVGSATTGTSGTATLSYLVDGACVLGDHVVAATFEGESAYLASSGSAVLTVGASPTAVRIHAPDPVASGAYLRIYSYLLRSADGAMLEGRTVQFALDGRDAGIAVTDRNGYCEVWVPVPLATPPGTVTVAARFDGDARHLACSGTASAAVTAGEAVSMYVNSPSGGMGATVTLYAYLWRSSDHAMLGGRTILFYVDGGRVGSAKTDAHGYARISYRIPAGTPPGSHPLKAEFLGDSSYRSQSRVSILASAAGWATVLSAPSRQGVQGLPIVLYAYLWRPNDHAMLQGRGVRFTSGAGLVGEAITDANGYAAVTYTIPPGTAAGRQGIVVSFEGADDLEPASATQLVTVSERDTLSWYVADRTAKPLARTVLYAYIRSRTTGKPVSGRTVSFSVDGVTVGSATSRADGYVECTYIVPPGLTPGAHAILASFSGDTAYEPGSRAAVLQLP